MRIVLCTNQLPRDDPGGVGSFSVNLAAELARGGHDVCLIAGSARRPSAPAADADVLFRRRDCWLEEIASVPGVRTLRLLRADDTRTRLGRFTQSFTHRRAEEVLADGLRQLRPQVVHIQHTLNLTARLSTLGIAVGAAVVATVHDYWPICHRIDLRRPDGEICAGPAGGLRCAGCLLPLKRSGGRSLNLWDSWQYMLRSGERSVEVGVRLAPYLLRTHLVQGGYALAHRVTCPAPAVADLLQRAGFDGRRMSIVDYGVPRLPQEVACEPRPHRTFCLGFLGTLGPRKGLWVALRAVESLIERAPGPWKLEIHGGPLRDPLLRERMHALAERSGGRVEYRGPYSAERLPGILTRLDAVVIPSVWQETGPMVWMEAMAAGLPVVASHIGALARRVRHGEDGLLFAPGDAGALTEALQDVMSGYESLRQGALRRPVRGVDQAAGEMLSVYDEAMAQARADGLSPVT